MTQSQKKFKVMKKPQAMRRSMADLAEVYQDWVKNPNLIVENKNENFSKNVNYIK